GGSNIVVGDGGMRGIVVKLGRGFARITWEEEADGESRRAGRSAQGTRAPHGPPEVFLFAGAAVQIGRLARDAVERGLAGLEYAEGIPGTVGGALFMNAGAYGGEVSDTVDEVEGVDATGAVRRLPRASLAFVYRRTVLPAGFLVT